MLTIPDATNGSQVDTTPETVVDASQCTALVEESDAGRCASTTRAKRLVAAIVTSGELS